MLKKIDPAEWVCVVFLFISSLILIFSPLPVAWHLVNFSVISGLEFFAVALASLLIKEYRGEKVKLISLLGLLICTYWAIKPPKETEFYFFLHRFQFVLIFVMIAIFFKEGTKRHFFKSALSRFRSIVPILSMVSLYPVVPLMIHSASRADQDVNIAAWDRIWFFGRNPFDLIEGWIQPWLSEWMAFAYSFYAILILLVFSVLYLRDNEEEFREFIFSVVLCLAIGYMGYVLIPVQGPVYFEGFGKIIDLHYMKTIKETMMDKTRIERDCFPSLHTAVSIICMVSAWRYVRTVFWICFPIAVCIPFACVYLRYHYVTDVIAGSLLACIVIQLELFLRKYRMEC